MHEVCGTSYLDIGVGGTPVCSMTGETQADQTWFVATVDLAQVAEIGVLIRTPRTYIRESRSNSAPR